jgi:hypothetical protein
MERRCAVVRSVTAHRSREKDGDEKALGRWTQCANEFREFGEFFGNSLHLRFKTIQSSAIGCDGGLHVFVLMRITLVDDPGVRRVGLRGVPTSQL